jgi:cobalt/nickel transport system permease protein
VHISDGILGWPWIAVGFNLMAIGLAIALYRVPQELIPRLGVLTAVFFVASQVHVPLGPVSVHLILNGLMGILLGFRCVIAIAVGLALQAFLVGHGGYTTLGINFAVYRILPIRFRIVPSILLGSGTALLTVLLNTLVLYFGAKGDWAVIARASVILHLPIIALEGVIVACALRVLANARPEWLGLTTGQFPSGNTSANGTSH